MYKNLQEILLKCVHGQHYSDELQTVTNDFHPAQLSIQLQLLSTHFEMMKNSCVLTTDFKSVTNHFILFTLQVVYRFTLIHFSHVSKIQHGEFSFPLDRSQNKGTS